MAPKRKTANSSAAVIPAIDPNSQLPFAGNHFEAVSGSRISHKSCGFSRLCFPCPSSCISASESSLPLASYSVSPVRSKMAPKRKTANSSAAVIPAIDPNSQLPFAGNHMSVISEAELLRLVSIGVLPPRELCSWRICHALFLADLPRDYCPDRGYPRVCSLRSFSSPRPRPSHLSLFPRPP